MSEWIHNLTIACPQALMAEANQLALAIGTSPDDVDTFRSADWTDGTGLFSVANTRAVDMIFEYLAGYSMSPDVPDLPYDHAMMLAAIDALSFVTVTQQEDGSEVITGNDSTKIRVAVDMEPLQALSLFRLYKQHFE